MIVTYLISYDFPEMWLYKTTERGEETIEGVAFSNHYIFSEKLRKMGLEVWTAPHE